MTEPMKRFTGRRTRYTFGRDPDPALLCEFCEIEATPYSFGPHGCIGYSCPSCAGKWTRAADGKVTITPEVTP